MKNKFIHQLAFNAIAHNWVAQVVDGTNSMYPPQLCSNSLRDLFKIPRDAKTIYATVCRDRPTAERLEPCYLEFRYDEDEFLEIRHPWKGQIWQFEATLSELDQFIKPLIKLGRRYFVYFEVD